MRTQHVWTKTTAGLILLVLATASQAMTVNINFRRWNGPDSYTGPGAVGQIGDVWNTVWRDQTSLASNLQDTQGNTTTVTFQKTGAGAYNCSGDDWHPVFYAYTNDEQEFVIGGLDPQKTYDVYLYNEYNYGDYNGKFYLDMDGDGSYGGALDVSARADSAGDPNVLTFEEGENYVAFYDVTPLTTGEIKGYTWEGPWNGLQIVEVPEPATIGLLGLGGLVTLFRRKR